MKELLRQKREIDETWFTFLLYALVAVYVGNPVAEALLLPEHDLIGRIITTTLTMVVTFPALKVASERVIVYRIAVVFAVAAIGLRFFTDVFPSSTLLVISFAGIEGIFLLATITIGKFLFNAKEASADTIRAAICFYMLVAMQWAFVYTVLSLIDPGAFSVSSDLAAKGARVEMGTEASSIANYFSLVTMTTLGYGDVSPASEIARMLAGIQAIFGQFYLAVVVARLVALNIAKHR